MSSDEEGGEEEKTEEVLVTNDVNKVWESYVDETSGGTYYYNILTGQSVWNLEETQTEEPPEFKDEIWESYFDENGYEYYYNCITGETSWELPSQKTVTEIEDKDTKKDTEEKKTELAIVEEQKQVEE